MFHFFFEYCDLAGIKMNMKPVSRLRALILFCVAIRKEAFASQVVSLKNEVKVRETRERNVELWVLP